MSYIKSKISSFKGRSIDYDSKVYVYRNLVRKGVVYSIMQNNLVVGHTTELFLYNCEFKINKSGLNRAKTSGIRNVHAYVVGYISDKSINNTELSTNKIYYNPFTHNNFVDKNNETIENAKLLYFNENGVNII